MVTNMITHTNNNDLQQDLTFRIIKMFSDLITSLDIINIYSFKNIDL